MPERNGSNRAFWSGTVSFGLVSVPVVLFPANRSGGARLRMLAPDGTPLARRYVCPRDERALDDDEIVRGYEIRKGRYVVLTDAELEALEPKKSRDIDLRQFVAADELDPLYFERAYYLAPAGDSTKAYTLLARIMEKRKRAGIATFVMRDREYLVAILAERGILRAETLRFADEIRAPEDVGLDGARRPSARAVGAFEKAIRRLARRGLDPDDLTEHYAERVAAIARAKRKRREGVVEHRPTEEAAEAVDLLEALRSTLRSGGRRAASAAKRTAARRPGRGKKRASGRRRRAA